MKKIFIFTLIFTLLFNSFALGGSYLDSVNNKDIRTGSVGGEWLVIAKARDKADSSFDDYYSNLADIIKECNGDIDRRYTTYSRIIIALTAIGKDPSNIGGYDITQKLEDYDKVTSQGINGTIFAIIATKCGGYKNFQCESYLKLLLSKQNADGSFSLNGDGDVDVTAMALQALSFYSYRQNVMTAVNNALQWLYNSQPCSSESLAQMMVAYTALSDFVSKDKIDALYADMMEYSVEGGYCHTKGEGINPMASEQVSYALTAYNRYIRGETPLYHINNNKEICLK